MKRNDQISQMVSWATAILDSSYNGMLAAMPNVERLRSEIEPFANRAALDRCTQKNLDEQYPAIKSMYDKLIGAQEVERRIAGRVLSAEEARRLTGQ